MVFNQSWWLANEPYGSGQGCVVADYDANRIALYDITCASLRGFICEVRYLRMAKNKRLLKEYQLFFK